MIRWLSASGGLLGVCLVLSACGKSSNDAGGTGGAGGDGGGESTGVSQAAFASSYAQVLCKNMAGCCDAAQLEYDADNCEKTATKELQSMLDAATTPNAIYDEQAAGDCLEIARAQAACGNWGHLPIYGACAHLFTGKLDTGETCTTSTECKSQVCYAHSDDSKPFVCVANDDVRAPVGKQGEACTTNCPDADNCFVGPTTTAAGAPAEPRVACSLSEGLSCQDGTCQLRPGVGEKCKVPGECSDGLACDANTCVPKYKEGHTCFLDGDCTTGLCEKGVCIKPVTAAQCKTDGPSGLVP